MESLIPIISKLQDVFSTVGTETIQLPQIVVIGAQSAGKSSVLESLVGKTFLPRGIGMVTRRPLNLHLIKLDSDEKEYAKFLHTKDKIFDNFQKVCQEIVDETSRGCENLKGISNEPICLRVYSPNVVNLTLVDLPGLTRNAIKDQPADIVQQINDLNESYVKQENTLILAVSPANVDFANSESLEMAKKFDPNGQRTLAVLTKLDLMDTGTDAIDVLCQKVIRVNLGIIGVVNRSQQDIIDNKSIKDSLEFEQDFLQKKYPGLAHRNGQTYLALTLNRLLMSHIQDNLPHLKIRINRELNRYHKLLDSSGREVVDKASSILEYITKFATNYTSAIDGTSQQIETKELSGGARICYIFHKTFGDTLKSVEALGGLKEIDILTATKNANGPRPTLFVPEVTFELLVKRQIKQFEEPVLRCVELVHEELQRLITQCNESANMTRFPKLQNKIIKVVSELLRTRLLPTNQFVKGLVDMELAYINTYHPDFENTKMSIMKTHLQEAYKAIEEQSNNYMMSNLHSGEHNRTTTPSPSKTSSISSESNLSQKEKKDVYIIQKLIVAYFKIVRKNIQDSVPKAIMHLLVNESREQLQSNLVSELYKPGDFEDLLTENSMVAQRRLEYKKRLVALEKASLIVGEIRDTKFY